MALDKKRLGVFKCKHMKRLGGFIKIGIPIKIECVGHFQGFIENHHLKKMHTFNSDLSLLYLEVYSSTFIHLKVSTRLTQNFKIQLWLVKNKILKTFMEELGCECLISWKWGYRGDVILPFSKHPMPFGGPFRGLKLYNELLKDVKPIIQKLPKKEMNSG